MMRLLILKGECRRYGWSPIDLYQKQIYAVSRTLKNFACAGATVRKTEVPSISELTGG